MIERVNIRRVADLMLPALYDLSGCGREFDLNVDYLNDKISLTTRNQTTGKTVLVGNLQRSQFEDMTAIRSLIEQAKNFKDT